MSEEKKLPLLKVNGIHVYYGAIHAIKGISLEVNEGEIVTLIGANGAGKSSTLRAIAGLEKAASGSIVFQGEDIVVVSKPSGMLSVPGKDDLPNVQNSMKSRFSEATGPMIVHRLDMDTSGLMVLALTDERYHQLQEMFLKHQVEKTYIALLEHPMAVGQEGEIRLPLRPDIDDRPRQMVDPVHGRTAVTLYRVVGEKDGHALVELRPQTGRTHQLRVHCAHPQGLDNPIVGDRLYGTAGPRLMLHAARLRFDSYDFTDNDECFAL